MENTNSRPPEETLFQYRPPRKWAYDNLCNQVLYFNSPLKFNDPYDVRMPMYFRGMTNKEFEFLRVELPRFMGEEPRKRESKEEFVRRYSRGFQEKHAKLKNRIGFACFSERKDNLLMWSHYSGGGRGFCLEFDTRRAPFADEDVLARIDYKGKLPRAADFVKLIKERNDGILANLVRKSESWKYEQEWRMVKRIDKNPHEPESDTHELSYGDKALRAIYFGPRATTRTKKRVYAIVQKKYPAVKMWQGELDDDKYKIKFEKPYP